MLFCCVIPVIVVHLCHSGLNYCTVCYSAECHFAVSFCCDILIIVVLDCPSTIAVLRFVILLNTALSCHSGDSCSDVSQFAQFWFGVCHSDECWSVARHSAACHSSECRGTKHLLSLIFFCVLESTCLSLKSTLYHFNPFLHLNKNIKIKSLLRPRIQLVPFVLFRY